MNLNISKEEKKQASEKLLQLRDVGDEETGNKGCNSAHYSPPTLTMTAGSRAVPPSNDFSMRPPRCTTKKLQRRAQEPAVETCHPQ